MDRLLERSVRLCPLLHIAQFRPTSPTNGLTGRAREARDERLRKFEEHIYADIRPVQLARGETLIEHGQMVHALAFLVRGQLAAVSSQAFDNPAMLFPLFEQVRACRIYTARAEPLIHDLHCTRGPSLSLSFTRLDSLPLTAPPGDASLADCRLAILFPCARRDLPLLLLPSLHVAICPSLTALFFAAATGWMRWGAVPPDHLRTLGRSGCRHLPHTRPPCARPHPRRRRRRAPRAAGARRDYPRALARILQQGAHAPMGDTPRACRPPHPSSSHG